MIVIVTYFVVVGRLFVFLNENRNCKLKSGILEIAGWKLWFKQQQKINPIKGKTTGKQLEKKERMVANVDNRQPILLFWYKGGKKD